MASMATSSLSIPHDRGEQSDSSLSTVSSSYLSVSSTSTKRSTPLLTKYAQSLLRSNTGGSAIGNVVLSSSRLLKAKSGGKAEQSKSQGEGLRKSRRNERLDRKQAKVQQIKVKGASKGSSQVRSRNSITKTHSKPPSRRASTLPIKTNDHKDNLARAQRGKAAPAANFVRSTTTTLPLPNPIPPPSSTIRTSTSTSSSSTRKRKLSTTMQRAPSPPPPPRPFKQHRRTPPLHSILNDKQLRSQGPADGKQIPWGWKNGGVLLGQPPKVQERERRKEEKMRKKRAIDRKKLEDAERRINGDVKEKRSGKRVRVGKRKVEEEQGNRTVEVVVKELEKTKEEKSVSSEEDTMETRQDPSTREGSVVEKLNKGNKEEVTEVDKSSGVDDNGSRALSEGLERMDTSGTPESETSEPTGDVSMMEEERPVEEEQQTESAMETPPTSPVESLDPLAITSSSVSSRPPRAVITTTVRTITTKRISRPPPHLRDEQSSQVEPSKAEKMGRVFAKDRASGKELQRDIVEVNRNVETDRNVEVQNSRSPTPETLPSSLRTIDNISTDSRQAFASTPLFDLSSSSLTIRPVPLAPPRASTAPRAASPAPPQPFTFGPSQSASDVMGVAAMEAASALLKMQTSSLSQRPRPQPQPASSKTKRIVSSASNISLPPKTAPRKSAPPKELDPALVSKEGWVLPERDLRIRENGRPPVWAVGRQELCETLDYFKSYQGGHYDRKERCFGYLLDGFPSANDRCEQNGKVIISHGGGNSHSTTAGYVLHSSQERNNMRMRALQNCLDRQVPVMLLAGNQYSFFPKLREMGYVEGGNEVRYAVLGAFLITDLWAEGEPVEPSSKDTASAKDEYFVRFKVRFEWVESQGTPWFTHVMGKESSPMSETGSTIYDWSSTSHGPAFSPTMNVTCQTCKKSHRAIYLESITCYDESCVNFFRLPDGRMVPPASLNYNPSLLSSTLTSSSTTLIPQPVIPQTLQSLATSSQTRDYSKVSWRGFGCSECGRLSSRSEWLKLSCQECGAEVDAAGDKLTIKQILEQVPTKTTNRSPKDPMGPVLCASGIEQIARRVDGFKGFTFDLGHGSKVHQMWPDNSEEADRLLAEYQGEEAGTRFKRNPLTVHRSQGSLLCQQFTWNGGEEYLHAIAAQTYPFENTQSHLLDRSPSDSGPSRSTSQSMHFAAPCAKDACEYLKKHVPKFVGEDKADETQFNEILSVAYMTGGKMNFHDDGEIGLGSIVSSISLGSDAIMSFRPKEQNKRGAKKKQDNPIDPKSRGPKAVLKLRLRHSHIMVMEGAEMQKMFEHAVEPEGLRFAATARLVGPEHARKGRKQPAGQPKTENLNPIAHKVRKQKSSTTRAPLRSSPSPPTTELPPDEQLFDVQPRSPISSSDHSDRYHIISFDLDENIRHHSHTSLPSLISDTPSSSAMSRASSSSSTPTSEPLLDPPEEARDVAPPQQNRLDGMHFKKVRSSSTIQTQTVPSANFYPPSPYTSQSSPYPTYQHSQTYPQRSYSFTTPW